MPPLLSKERAPEGEVLASFLGLLLLSCQAKPKIEEQFALKDLTPPQVVSITPANGTTEVSDKPTIVVVFNEPMDAATLNSSTVTVATDNGTPGVGSYEYAANNNALTIKIVQNLYLNTQYAITVTNQVKDRAGNAINPVTSTFSTDQCPKLRQGQPIFNDYVRALVRIGCTIFAGGSFTSVNEVARNYLAAVDTSGRILSWNPNAGSSVLALAAANGVVFAGGNFTTISASSRPRIAAIASDGTLHSWNPDVNGGVSALATSGSTIYVGGSYTSIGANTRNRLAAISIDSACLSSYSAACLLAFDPSATDGVFTTGVYALALADGALYAGGNFTKIGGVTRNHLAAFGSDGSLLTWDPNVAGVSTPSIFTLLAAGKTLYAAGHFTTIGGNFHGRMVSLNTDGSVNW